MKKRVIALVLVLAMAVGMTACSGSSGQTNVKEATDETAGVANNGPSDDADRHSIVIAHDQTANTFPPNDYMHNMVTGETIYEALWYCYYGGEPDYRIAKSREWVDEAHCRIILRDDVYDHAGNQIKASDVLFSFELCQGTGGVIASNIGYVDVPNSEIVGDFELILAMTEGTCLNDYGISWCPIVSEKSFNDSPDQMVNTPIGTGPYVMTEYVSGSHCVLTYFEDYYRLEEPPQITEIKVMFVLDPTQRANLLLSGEADFAFMCNFTDLATIEGTDGLDAFFEAPSNQLAISFNNGPTSVFYNNPEFRKAVAYAVNKEAMSGINTLGNAPVSKVNMGIANAVGQTQECFDIGAYEYDVEKAKEMLAAANVPEGTVVTMFYGSTAGHDRLAEMVQQACKEIGIEVELVYDANWMTNLFANPEAFDMTIISYQSDPLPVLYNTFGPTNMWHFDDAAHAEFMALADQITTDTSGTYQYAGEMAAFFYDNCYGFGVYDDATYHGKNKNLIPVFRTALTPEFVEWRFE